MAPEPAGREFARWLESVTPSIERALEAALPEARLDPRRLHRALRYMIFPGGKRIRPALALLGHETAGGRPAEALQLAAALELIHTFSLIHDDLPCMDDDDFRRGRLSCHRKFGEAIAVLAGDAMQVLAFEILARLPASPGRRLRVLEEITRAVGTRGVIGGQVVDIESEGRRISEARLRDMHERKTAALLRAALVSGAILAGAKPRLLEALTRFGDRFGLLFQVVDDVLNEVGSYEALGRRRGGDRQHGKATYPAILGETRTRTRLRELLLAAASEVPTSGPLRRRYLGLLEAVVIRLPEAWSRPALVGAGLGGEPRA